MSFEPCFARYSLLDPFFHRHDVCKSVQERKSRNVRGLVVLAARKHDDVRGRGLGCNSPVVGIFASGSLGEQAHTLLDHTTNITLTIRGQDTEQALPCFLGQIRLLKDALSGVDVGQIESGSGVARVEYSCQSDAC